MSPRHPRTIAVLVAAVAATAAAAPAAHADGFACEASAVRANVLGVGAEPVRAGAPDACPNSAQVLDALSAPLGGNAASARTAATGDRAMAASSVSGLSAAPLTSLLGELPQIPLPAGIGSLPVQLPAGGKLLGLPSLINVDATEAAQKLITGRALPDVPLMAADLVQTAVGAACQADRLVMNALSTVENLTALGHSFPTDRAIDTSVPLVDAQTVDFSTLDIGLVDLPAGLSLSDPLTGSILRTALQSAVAGLPEVAVPAAIGRVVVEPAARQEGGDALRQLGPRVRVEALGREVVDMTLGDALVTAKGILCGGVVPTAIVPAPEPDFSPAVEEALSCATSDVVLTDVTEHKGQVKLVGLAAERFVGRTVDIVLSSTGERVATAVVQPDGYFRARAPLPDDEIRYTNAARYQAAIDDERSLALKLHRVMRITRMKPEGDWITIAGRIYDRRPDSRVIITRREDCTRDVDVTTVKPGRDGRWRVRIPVPEGMEAATYRATTVVRKSEGGKRFRTYTLPGHVAL